MQDIFRLIGMSIGVFALFFGIAFAFERLRPENRHRLTTARYVSIIGMSAALSGLLMLVEIPLLFLAPEFYKIDLSELPVLLCGFYLGPVAGVVCELLKVLVKLLIKGTTTSFVGDFANFTVGCMLVVPACVIYHLRKTKRAAVIGLAAGTLIMSVFGAAFNALYLLPAFSKLFGLPLDTILAMGAAIQPRITGLTRFVLFAVLPLNLIKGTLVSVLSMLLYKRVQRVLFRNPS